MNEWLLYTASGIKLRLFEQLTKDFATLAGSIQKSVSIDYIMSYDVNLRILSSMFSKFTIGAIMFG